MDLAVARRDVRAMFAEPMTVCVSDAELNDMLDEGQLESAVLTLGYQKRVAFLDTDGTRMFMDGVREYDISDSVGSAGLGISDCIRVMQVFLNGQSLPLWTPQMVTHADMRTTTGGAVRYWYQFAGRVGFVPYPDNQFVTDTTWTVELVYAAVPAEWTTGDGVLPSGFDELPTLFALERVLTLRRRWTDAHKTYEQYAELAGMYRQLSLMQAASPMTALKQPTEAYRPEEPRRAERRRG